MPDYVHGYSARESIRLVDQAETLAELLHSDTIYPPQSTVLEAGCGVGAQTVILAKNNLDVAFTSIDISQSSIAAAAAVIRKEQIRNVSLARADIFDLPFEKETFDHVFVCFVLEHLKEPLDALIRLKSMLKKGGSLTVIEGDHGSTYFHPQSGLASQTIQCLVDIQAKSGGNSLIGRELYPLLKKAGFDNPVVSPRMVYVDSSRPALVEGFTKNTFIAMVEGVQTQALQLGMMRQDLWDQGIRELKATSGEDGVFCYTFFKGRAVR